MMPSMQCPKCGCSHFVVAAKAFRFVPRSFLGWAWIAQVHDGFVCRCLRHACGRDWRVGLDGMHEPAARATPGRVSAPVPAPPDREREEREREPDNPLDAVRRPEV